MKGVSSTAVIAGEVLASGLFAPGEVLPEMAKAKVARLERSEMRPEFKPGFLYYLTVILEEDDSPVARMRQALDDEEEELWDDGDEDED